MIKYYYKEITWFLELAGLYYQLIKDVCVCVCLIRVVSDSFETLWIVALQAALFMGFPRQEYLGGLPFPSAGI